MTLYYDLRDDSACEIRGLRTLYWLDDLGATPIQEAKAGARGFLFAGARSIEDYAQLISKHPLLSDPAPERALLLRLDAVLDRLLASSVAIPQPRTWRLGLDAPLPEDLLFPLFVRTVESSWKLGGQVSKVENREELEREAAELRRGIRWDATILAREWLELKAAGQGHYGPVPQEARIWIVDGQPLAWSFHHAHVISHPKGFPLKQSDLEILRSYGKKVGAAFASRLIAADFARDCHNSWNFIEAGPGSCAGTAHEAVFKAVARSLMGQESSFRGDELGGLL